jgi:hypothetical protein
LLQNCAFKVNQYSFIIKIHYFQNNIISTTIHSQIIAIFIQSVLSHQKFAAITMQNNLYLVEWPRCRQEKEWDVYSSFVVCCANEDEARNTHPGGRVNSGWDNNERGSWIKHDRREELTVKLLGTASASTLPDVINASFHAG